MRIFVDTSVFFKRVYGFLKYGKLDFVKNFVDNGYVFVISEYVIDEILEKREKIDSTMSEVDLFYVLGQIIKLYWIDVVETELVPLDSIFFEYVNDVDDTQILYDAVKGKIDILFTDNIKDFKVDKIKKDFNIEVTNKI